MGSQTAAFQWVQSTSRAANLAFFMRKINRLTARLRHPLSAPTATTWKKQRPLLLSGLYSYQHEEINLPR
jgi:hypothetical protein